MPIYEYECPKCGLFEAVQKMSDAPLDAQPDCPVKGCPHKAQRRIAAAAFHLKGSGWYKTDYSSGGSSSGKSKGSTTGTTGDTKTEGPDKSDKSDKKDSTKKESSSSEGSGGCGPGCGCH